jgi:hypothetical protein
MIVAAWVFGSLLLLFLMFFVLYPIVKNKPLTLDDTTGKILGFFCAAVAGLFGVFFTGTIVANLGGKGGSIGNIGAQATGGMALFLVVLFWWRSSHSPLQASGKDVAIGLQALARVFQGIDQHYPEIRQVVSKEERLPASDYRVVAEARNGAIDFVDRRSQTATTTITAEDLERLPENDRQYIKSIERSLQTRFRKWTSLYPKRAKATDTASRERLQKELEDIAAEICSELQQIFRHLGTLGYALQDHYSAMQSICIQHQQRLERLKANAG